MLEEQLSGEIGLAHFEHDAIAALRRELAHQLPHHLPAYAAAAELGMDREIEDVQTILVQLVDHEADHPFRVLSHHADAVALPQAADEIIFRPGKLEAFLLNHHHFG